MSKYENGVPGEDLGWPDDDPPEGHDEPLDAGHGREPTEVPE